MRLCSMHQGAQFFPVKEVFSFFGILVFLTFSHYVRIVFPTCPQNASQILNVFPQAVPNSTSISPIMCAESHLLGTYRCESKGCTCTIIWVLLVKTSIWGVSKVSEFICDRPIKKRLIAKKHFELGRHLTTNYCESHYITPNGKLKVKKMRRLPVLSSLGLTKRNLTSNGILETFLMM